MRSALRIWTAFILLLLYAPLLVMAAFSFNESKYATSFTGFTLDWYRRVVADSELVGILWNTLTIALGSMVLATVLGTMAALGLRRRFRGRRLFSGLVATPVMVPDIVLGISLLVFFRALSVPISLGTALVAHTTFNMAYVAIVVSARLEGMDPLLELAAYDLGASPWQAFWKVTFPLIAPAVFSGALLAFTLSFDDFVITYFTTGPGDSTLPMKIFSMVRHSISPKINALSTLILVVSVFLIAASRRMARLPVSEGSR